ncbi:MAG TPA: hypothetical protein VHF89_15615 [Solirubrobacteraceae bacterium]|nr:hypothetical protein [Solirubrobacteraceae bacterium]
MSDNWILAAALTFIVILGALTLVVLVRTGPDILTVVSLLVLAMFAFGIVGALRNPPDQ